MNLFVFHGCIFLNQDSELQAVDIFGFEGNEAFSTDNSASLLFVIVNYQYQSIQWSNQIKIYLFFLLF